MTLEKGTAEVLREEPVSLPLSKTNSTWVGPRPKSGLRGERPVTNRLPSIFTSHFQSVLLFTTLIASQSCTCPATNIRSTQRIVERRGIQPLLEKGSQTLWVGSQGVRIKITKSKYRVSQEECARLREGVPYVKVQRYNPKHLYPKLNGYGDNGKRSLKL